MEFLHLTCTNGSTPSHLINTNLPHYEYNPKKPIPNGIKSLNLSLSRLIFCFLLNQIYIIYTPSLNGTNLNKPAKSLYIILLPLICGLLCSLSRATSIPPFKETKMSLYFQDQVGGPNFTVIPVAGIQARRWFYTDFGTIMVTDDPLTLALDRNSPEVGQGAGTGKFRYARGYGTFETVFVEESTILNGLFHCTISMNIIIMLYICV